MHILLLKLQPSHSPILHVQAWGSNTSLQSCEIANIKFVWYNILYLGHVRGLL